METAPKRRKMDHNSYQSWNFEDTIPSGDCRIRLHSGLNHTNFISSGSPNIAAHGCICSMTLDPQGRLVILSTGVRGPGAAPECIIRRYENGTFHNLFISRLPFIFNNAALSCIRVNSRGEIFVGLGEQNIIKVTSHNFLAPFSQEYDRLPRTSIIAATPQRSPFASAGTCVFEIDAEDRIFSIQNMKFCMLQGGNTWTPLFAAPSKSFAITGDTVSFAITHEHRVVQYQLDGKKIGEIGGYGKNSLDGTQEEASFDRPLFISGDKYGTLVVLEATGKYRIIDSGLVFTLSQTLDPVNRPIVVFQELLHYRPVHLVLDAQHHRILTTGAGLSRIWEIKGMRRHVLHFDPRVNLASVINRTDCGPLKTLVTADASITVHEALLQARCRHMEEDKLADVELSAKAAEAFVNYLYTDSLDQIFALEIDDKLCLWTLSSLMSTRALGNTIKAFIVDYIKTAELDTVLELLRLGPQLGNVDFIRISCARRIEVDYDRLSPETIERLEEFHIDRDYIARIRKKSFEPNWPWARPSIYGLGRTLFGLYAAPNTDFVIKIGADEIGVRLVVMDTRWLFLAPVLK
eukprot:TRINITY_DN10651_c0_g1_i1.p1 TRINITY_DN10651_c0_g1~~TRINITY_DN10651_c0_g1_i1.p1  ORF type:complete len:576 (+),score=87.79 TRINITY_DN10651_c0_g1_i1:47-1774(+)